MLINKKSNLSLTILGSTLREFESLHTEYSQSSQLGFTTLYEDVGFKPFKVTLYYGQLMEEGSYIEHEFMTSLSEFKASYYLHPILEHISTKPSIDTSKDMEVLRVEIHLRVSPSKWIEPRIIIQKEGELIFDVSSPSHLSIKDTIDVKSGLYVD